MKRTIMLALLTAAAAFAAVEAPISATAPPDTPVADDKPVPPETPGTPAPPEPVEATEMPAAPEPLAAPPAARAEAAPAPLPLPPPAAEFISPRQGVYGALLEVEPAHKLAMLEADEPVFEDDPLVARASFLLAQSTARYIEDAPRIAELTIRVCNAIRAKKGSVSPLEMLEASGSWTRPSGSSGAIPRRFEHYAARYRALRIDEGKDHAQALTAIQAANRPSSATAKPR